MRKKRRVVVVTGSRAEYGLLKPVMRAVMARKDLELRIVACGSHLIGDAKTRTVREIERDFRKSVLAAKVEMQSAVGKARGKRRGTSGAGVEAGRVRDALAVGAGVSGLAAVFAKLDPERSGWVVVLGDRIEAFAAASAASIGGFALAHIHGGDRAEGIADEAMRHAITKLAHVHLPATTQSARRIVKMGEDPRRVFVVGSPAVDGLGEMDAEHDGPWDEISAIVLHHPAGLGEREERRVARNIVRAVSGLQKDSVLLFSPNHDAGREVIVEEWARARERHGWRSVEHLPREEFVGVLKRLREGGGVLVGNSSAGLIECAALGVAVVNVGPRQAGRERDRNVVDVAGGDAGEIEGALRTAARRGRWLRASGRYGDGHAGERIAAILADPRVGVGEAGFIRKRNMY